jgi:energy-coupling factor transport system ATP-binding protein
MLGMGLSGFLAGVIFSGRLRPEKAALCVFGALAALLVYGPTVNFASALIWQPNLNWGMVLAALASGLPFDLIHAGATVIFLWLGAEPMLRKLERMETKYGVMSQTAGKLC